MGMLDDLLKGAAGAGLVAVATKLINDNGGLGGLMDKFQKGGLGAVFGSWVSTGQNQPVSPDQVQQIVGSDQIAQIAAKLGLPADQVVAHLSQLLPQVVDKLTPNGQVSQASQEVDPNVIHQMLSQS
ncbi:YidB family protein [Meiothermus granaticius]|uniref:DUF937 domain-containing protein n=1 Tax=Meiothermus granaticius NBRC 107808 TaxID=1227551 RepID=A0A399F7S6_9DEIN|nr:YidB family protein [Meiothermus granaticius]RIH92288.1 hypothetical protein Mgrana_01838 [Meiothermus granaticius NBRC 107808]GEM86498.1 hypothetical protein MGR01S_11230 [Meiothermus granaticius NBRC 107808]